MSRVVLDSELRAKLGDLTRAVELVDESGEKVGVVLPEESYRQLLRVASGAEEDEFLTEEELARLRREPTYSTAEVLHYLRSL